MKTFRQFLIPLFALIIFFPGLIKETLNPIERPLQKSYEESVLIDDGATDGEKAVIAELVEKVRSDKENKKKYGKITYGSVLRYLRYEADTLALLSDLPYGADTLVVVANPKKHIPIACFSAKGKHSFICNVAVPMEGITVKDLWLETPEDSCGVYKLTTPSKATKSIEGRDVQGFAFDTKTEQTVITLWKDSKVAKMTAEYKGITTEDLAPLLSERFEAKRRTDLPEVDALFAETKTKSID